MSEETAMLAIRSVIQEAINAFQYFDLKNSSNAGFSYEDAVTFTSLVSKTPRL